MIRLPLSRATAQRIRRRYNKNGSSEPRLKTLDGLTSERWIQWLGLESDYHCSFSSTRNAEDVVAGEAASSDHDQKISRVTRKRPREPKSTNDILVAGQKLSGAYVMKYTWQTHPLWQYRPHRAMVRRSYFISP